MQRDEVVVPDALHDPNNPRQPWASSAVKETLVEFACRDEYSSDVMFGISAANPQAAQALSSVYLQATPEELDEDNPFNTCDDSDVHADLDERRRLKKVTQAELSLCLKARMANQALLPFLTVCMTLMCYKTGMSDDAWGTLCAMGLVYNRRWVGDFCTLVSARLVAAASKGALTNIVLVVFDNCGYRDRTSYQSTEGEGSGFFNTVNWLWIPLAKQFAAKVKRGQWHNGQRTFHVRRFFSPSNPRVARFLTSTWMLYIGAALDGADVLTRPAGAPTEKTRVIYGDPIPGVGTAGYDEITAVMAAIGKRFIETTRPADVVLTAGDQQSYNRMVWKKKDAPKANDWYVPLPGEFHMVAHVLMAIHILWWQQLSSWAVQELGWHKTVKDAWVSVEEWHHYDRFYMTLIAALTDYIAARTGIAASLVPRYLLTNPAVLLEKVAGNASATMIVRFLFGFGFPYLALRNAVRTNNSNTLDLMWIIAFHWWRATNKYQYAIMAVYVTATRHALVEPLEHIYVSHRTGSISGNAACNVALDFMQERANRWCKFFVVGHNLFERLKVLAAMLNTFVWVWPRFQRATGRPSPEDYENTDFKPKDRETLVTGLQRELGTTFDALTQVSTVNKFKSVPAFMIPPWQAVADFARDGSLGTPDTVSVSDAEGYDSDSSLPRETDMAWFKYVTLYLRKAIRI